MELGFLGLSQMGSAIAERLEQAGAKLHVFDPSARAAAPVVERGAVAHASARAVTDVAQIVFACLPESAVNEAVAREVAAGGAVRTVALGLAEAETLGVPLWVTQQVGSLWRLGITEAGATRISPR